MGIHVGIHVGIHYFLNIVCLLFIVVMYKVGIGNSNPTALGVEVFIDYVILYVCTTQVITERNQSPMSIAEWE